MLSIGGRDLENEAATGQGAWQCEIGDDGVHVTGRNSWK